MNALTGGNAMSTTAVLDRIGATGKGSGTTGDRRPDEETALRHKPSLS